MSQVAGFAKRGIKLLSGLWLTVVGGVFLVISLVLMLADVASPVDPAWVTVIICGLPLLYTAVYKLACKKGMSRISSSLLISLAMIAAIAIGELFAAGEVAFIMAVGEILEDKTVARARKGLGRLISLTPEQGRRVVDGREEMVAIELVAQGDVLRVLPGEAIPVDGQILVGNTSVDQSIITGESLPVDKSPGDEVFCGTINRFGSLDIRATKVGADSSLQKLIRLVQDAEKNKAPMQRTVDVWASWLVPIALLIAVVTFFVTADIIRGVTVLVVFCPCALVLATPTSIMAAIGQAAKHGVIIKSGEALERMGKVDLVAFDKTGTLTQGTLVISDVVCFSAAVSRERLLQLVASAEAYSEHPLGKAVVAHARLEGLALLPAVDFLMVPGKGISAVVEGRRLLCGSSAYLDEKGVVFSADAVEATEQLRSQGKALLLVCKLDDTGQGSCLGLVALSDTLRDSAKDMVAELATARTGTVLLTGDNRQTADYFADQVGITNIYAELLPAQKVERIQEYQDAGHHICMIGDGVNDAPALKAAYVGVAMGSMGSDIAVEAADIALTGDELVKIPYLKRLSNATLRLIKLNISLAMGINFVAIILSVLAVLNPVTGALVHNVGSVLVVLNAALLYDRKYL
ncbi:MAG: cation-translocating P-type ATPase [Coriobacteriia bacterium]|nr:cation-translocating P-type ATPase [Coriobacteriia bacterium]